MTESPAEAQCRFAAENDLIADRLGDAGHAAVYRDAAREYATASVRLLSAALVR